MKRLLLGLLGLVAVACARDHRGDAVPKGSGPLVVVYRVELGDGREVSRGGRLSVWAERPDRLHAELIAPVGGVTFSLDAGGGSVCIVDVAAGTAYVGPDGPRAIEALIGVRASVADAVAALLSGVSPKDLAVTRTGGADGALPDKLRLADGARYIALARVRVARLGTDPGALGTGVPPAHLPVRPLASLARAGGER